MAMQRVMRAGLFAVLAASFTLAMFQNPSAQTPAAGAPQAAADPWAATVDPRVQQRTYLFTDTGEQMRYALFVSSKVTKNTKSPLIVALHGLGGTQNTMVSTRLKTIDLAEEGGYIYVSPMGYNCGGWYGIPAGARGGRGPAAPAPPQAGAPPAGAPAAPPQAGAPQATANAAGAPQRGGGRGLACAGGGTAVTETAKVRELSEKDVMTVLDMLRKEFNVDERRIYLMGHSMGGSGTLFLGAKHAAVWAAIAAIAPPGAGSADGLAAAKMPVFVIQGDMDTAVPVAGTRRYVERLKELNATYEYLEIPGADHSITGIPEIYAFFAKHTKPAR